MELSICRNQPGLEILYQKYQNRLRHSYFIVFLLIQAFLSTVTIVMECIGQCLEDLVEVVITHGIVLAVCIILLIAIHKEKLFLQAPSSVSFKDGSRSSGLKTLGDSLGLLSVKSRSSWIRKASTVLIFIPLLAMQITMALAYASGRSFTTHWDWSLYMVLVCYIFFPLGVSVNAVLAILVSLVPIFMSVFVKSSRESGDRTRKVLVDFFVMVAGNAVGLYFCFMTEIALRRSFLDKRASIVAKYMREYEEETEEHLLSSIIPETMVTELRKCLREAVVVNKRNKDYSIVPILPSLSTKPFAKVFAHFHENVSILYADIVNFTPLTASMNEEELVRLLNDLFGKFDKAVKEFNCLRIKLLGDCYNCVSGIPDSTENHAWNCVLLGLNMIAIIREVRKKWGGIDVDMRIGIHSGSVYSCILGISKLQFDIWSPDAKIANHMEQAGRPGCVHISQATCTALGENHGFYFEPGRRDSFLEEKGVTTFFIPISRNRHFVSVETLISTEGLISVQNEMSRQPLLPNSQWLETEEIQPYFLAFKDLKLEWDFIRQPDMLIKYPILAASVLIIILGIIEILSGPEFDGWHHSLGYGYPVPAHSNHLDLDWLHPCKMAEMEEFPGTAGTTCMEDGEGTPTSHCFFMDSNLALLRLCLWCHSGRYYFPYRSMHGIDDRQMFILKGPFPIVFFQPFASDIPLTFHLCLQSLTQEFAVVLSTIFVFYHIHFLLKLGAMVVALSIYGIVEQMLFHKQLSEWDKNSVLQEESSLLPHVHYLLAIFLLLHVIDRQSEYLFKLEYKWKKSLLKEQEDAELAGEGRVCVWAGSNLISDFCYTLSPAERYLHQKHKKELYHERYHSAAVMFATILNFWPEEDANLERIRVELGAGNELEVKRNSLSFLNSIISDIDQLLLSHNRVQKIKLIGTTYMAAVGLEPRIESYVDSQDDNAMATRNSTSMVAFAAALIDLIIQRNRHGYQNLCVRIGIACGPVIAGVVGDEKPLYDIWGDTVNMASRLESTGEEWKIHISEEVNNFLRRHDIASFYRGLTKIKGKPQRIPTYFVDLDRFRKKRQHLNGFATPVIPGSFRRLDPKHRFAVKSTSDRLMCHDKSLDPRRIVLQSSLDSKKEHLQRTHKPLEDLYDLYEILDLGDTDEDHEEILTQNE
ncbi:unnamed protein product [Darwinula stevensoni]|uniref:adenylate cyclase n=1 Tax=Darwinula stevensoni TaxID=69355 RepID=A0A7R8XG89_9CRUS|nr:unnamed protein product [Darwinula stevensoni]CAG0891260.1 unnamed protein product [Darwinula stevensoni]